MSKLLVCLVYAFLLLLFLVGCYLMALTYHEEIRHFIGARCNIEAEELWIVRGEVIWQADDFWYPIFCGLEE